MKSLIRNIVFFSVALFVLPLLVAGVQVQGGLGTVFLGGLILTVLFMFIKPVLSIVTFPINVITLGFCSLSPSGLNAAMQETASPGGKIL